jgi:hypothetical protein
MKPIAEGMIALRSKSIKRILVLLYRAKTILV